MKAHHQKYQSRNFNSQPHEEADDNTSDSIDTANISTHSLTRRLTCLGWIRTALFSYFNSQPHEEADENGGLRVTYNNGFQLTASRGG